MHLTGKIVPAWIEPVAGIAGFHVRPDGQVIQAVNTPGGIPALTGTIPDASQCRSSAGRCPVHPI